MTEHKSGEVIEVNPIQWTGDNMDEIQKIVKTQNFDGESFVVGDTVHLSVHDGLAPEQIGGYIINHPTGYFLVRSKD